LEKRRSKPSHSCGLFLAEGPDEPLQVAVRQEVVARRIDWQTLDTIDSGAFDGLFENERRCGFKLDEAPTYVLSWCGLRRTTTIFWAHHLLLDGWSVSQFLEVSEATHLCAAIVLDQLQSRPYRDYIAWLKAGRPTAGATGAKPSRALSYRPWALTVRRPVQSRPKSVP
jgi:hypothetical protein